MKIIIKIFPFIAILSFALLTSCSHLNSSCLEINWYELGRQDSTKGLTKTASFSKRREVCLLDTDSIYAKAYHNGFDSGLSEYCSFKTGYIYSLSQMQEEISACPDRLKKEFQKGYEVGSYMKTIQSLQNEIQEKLQQVNQKLDQQQNNPFSISENNL